MVEVADEYRDLLNDETKAFACLATLMKDGSPQATPIWFNTDEEHILINSAVGRVKDRNIRRDRRIALMIVDPNDPYRYMQVRGKVVDISIEGAREHINTLSKKYTGKDVYSGDQVEETRVTYKILPESISY